VYQDASLVHLTVPGLSFKRKFNLQIACSFYSPWCPALDFPNSHITMSCRVSLEITFLELTISLPRMLQTSSSLYLVTSSMDRNTSVPFPLIALVCLSQTKPHTNYKNRLDVVYYVKFILKNDSPPDAE